MRVILHISFFDYIMKLEATILIKNSVADFAVVWWQKCRSMQKVQFFFSSSKAKRRGERTTVTIGLCASFCVPLTNSDLVVVWKFSLAIKCQSLWNLRMLLRVLNLMLGRILVSPFQELRKEKRWRTDKNNMHTPTLRICKYCDVQS